MYMVVYFADEEQQMLQGLTLYRIIFAICYCINECTMHIAVIGEIIVYSFY